MRDRPARERFTIFTADGPKGPRLVAKPGPLLVARSTQRPIYCFHFAPRRAWQLNTWDRLLIPKPFTRVHLRWSKRHRYPPPGRSEEMKAFHEQMQATLEDVRLEAERRARLSDWRLETGELHLSGRRRKPVASSRTGP